MLSTSNALVARTIFATGGGLNKAFLRYIIALTGKDNPNICFLPTANGDNQYTINDWYRLCNGLAVKPHVQRLFISSYSTPQTFEESLLAMDAIIVGGGNTLNMLAIWKVQGIDMILRKAYDKGIVLAGGSAGSLCWFNGGSTDSRPQQLSLVEGLGFISASHCPHYHGEPRRKPFYEDNILSGQLTAGYACDDFAGILFRDEKFIKAVSTRKDNHSYYLSVNAGKIDEKILEEEFIPGANRSIIRKIISVLRRVLSKI